MMKKEQKLLLVLYALGLAIIIYCNLTTILGEQQFVLLAKSMLHGHLYLGPESISKDGSYYQGFAYWPQGFFPSIVMLPFVALFPNGVHQGYVQFLLNLLNLFLLYKIALKITKNHITALWLGFAYVFSTAYIVVGFFAWSWWYAQIVATSCLLLILFEYFHFRRWLLIGIYLACAIATRIDLLLAVMFPLIMLMSGKEVVRTKMRSLLFLFVPVFFGLVLIALYNFLRFGSLLEFGYTYHIPAITQAGKMLAEHGTWNLFYVPTNLYYLFLSGLQGIFVPESHYLMFPFVKPDAWGMSIFITSPILLWCLKTKKKELVVKAAAVTAFCILLFLLGYFGIGAAQYGYRYALDFQPFLFVVLCFAFLKGMSWKAKAVILLSCLINMFLFPNIFTSVV